MPAGVIRIRFTVPANWRTVAGTDLNLECGLAPATATAGVALAWLVQVHPQFTQRLLTPDRRLVSWANIYLNGQELRALKGLETPLPDGAELVIVPAMAGG